MSYFTLIEAEAPGAIGSFGHSGTVHPQEPLAFDITKASFPSFVNSNVQAPSPPYLTVP